MIQESSKAIVLKSVFFKDNQKIITLFSEKLGLISALIKGYSSPMKSSLSELFCEAEYIFSKGNSDLRKYQDASILDLHLPLRGKLSYLKSASCLAQSLLSTQLPEKPSPHLYALFSSFLKQIPFFTSQETLLCCFYLKFLRHEGLYHKECEMPGLSIEDQSLLGKIAYLQSFEELKKEEVPPFLFSYIESFFFENFRA